ncbi:MAG: flagellar biosynthesis anti-sigma factor FlgM [Gammaproteobacteria bacterium]|nr:flagellar biosynthesis anti-sigma factor FlgM [Gammaproteobacteria bacterium]
MIPSDPEIIQYLEANADLIKNASGELSVINTSKIVEIHSRITAREYKIDTEKLADKLLSLEAKIEF